MAKHPRDEDDEKEAREAEKAPVKRTVKEGEPVNEASHQEPYPTGSPPDPMEEYNKAHPERSVEWTTGPEPARAARTADKPAEKREKK